MPDLPLHDFVYDHYEFQDYPAKQPLPERGTIRCGIEEAHWDLQQRHPIGVPLRTLETIYMRYSRHGVYFDGLHQLLMVAYGAHPLFGAHATLRIAGIIRLTHEAEEEFKAMTLASDTFARYAFTLAEAALCAKHAADCAKLAGRPKPVIAAWRARAKQLRAHRKKSR